MASIERERPTLSHLETMIGQTQSEKRDEADQAAIEMSQDALRAIAHGVCRGDAVAELEYLGLPVRTINMLENSRLQITALEQLVKRRRHELLAIPNFGTAGLQELLACLSRYNELDEAKRGTSPPNKPK